MMLMPARAVAGSECLPDLLFVLGSRRRDRHAADEEGRAAWVGENGGLFGTQPIHGRLGAEVAVPGDVLSIEPLLDKARIAAGRVGDRGCVGRAEVRQCPVQPEFVADHDGRCMHRGTEVSGELVDELLETGLVDRHRKPPQRCGVSQRRRQGLWRDIGCRDGQ